MAPRLIARQASAVVAGVAGSLNRVEDPAVAGTAAQMPVEGFGDRVSIACLSVLDQRRGTDENSRNAEPALHAAFEHERFAQDTPRVIRKAFDGDHVVPVHLFRFPQARQRGMSVYQHEAAAARAFRRTPVFGGHDAAFLAQHLEEMHPRLVRGADGFPV